MPFVASEVLLFNPDPSRYLPHRYPFLMLDQIVELQQGICAVAKMQISADGLFSQIFLVEAVAQLAGILTIQEEGEGGFLAAIDQAHFKDNATAGDVLTVSARVLKAFGRLFMVAGTVTCEDSVLLEVQLTLGVGKL